MISSDRIIEFMCSSGAEFIPTLHVYDSVDSTNTLLRGEAELGAPHGKVVIARSQTAGRGRMGRSFFSPEDTGIYMSILVRPSLSPDEMLFITPLTAVACARAVESSGCAKAQVKWVNDIYVDEKKAAGILVEGAVTPEGNIGYAVVGVGINLYSPKDGFPDEIKGIAKGAFDDGDKKIDRNRLIADFLSEFFALYNALPSHGFMEEYRRRSLLTGKSVTVSHGGNEYRGTAVDIDDSAHLIVECEDGERRAFHSGEARARAEG